MASEMTTDNSPPRVAVRFVHEPDGSYSVVCEAVELAMCGENAARAWTAFWRAWRDKRSRLTYLADNYACLAAGQRRQLQLMSHSVEFEVTSDGE